MSLSGVDQESRHDFTAGFLDRQLWSLPGNLKGPANDGWQNETLASIRLKVGELVGDQAGNATDRPATGYETYVTAQLTRHAERLRGLGQNVTSAALAGFLPAVAPES